MKEDKKFPIISAIVLCIICVSCVCSEWIMNHEPLYLNLDHIGEPPSGEFLFGTDTMGRDVFSMIWYGGRVSLLIGFLSAFLSFVIAILYGGLSGFSSKWLDRFLMKVLDLVLSIPSILLVLFLQAVMSNHSILSITITIGLTSWFPMAKMIRTEVRQLRKENYVLIAKQTGASFFYLLRVHFLPNVLPSILFMMITNIGSAIASEATLSFLGIGLPIEQVSWGTVLSRGDQALLANEWWLIVIPGFFLIVVILCITAIGNYFREETITKCSNLSYERNRKIRKKF